MAAKKKINRFNQEMDPMTESVALGSAFSVLFLLLLKTFVLAIPLGLVIAFAHHHSRKNGKKKGKKK